MHKHQQTLADLERASEPSKLEFCLYAATLMAATISFCVFCFSF